MGSNASQPDSGPVNKGPPIAYLTRTETFSAGHRLHSSYFPAEKNLQLYGKCNNPHGHGHNYRVEVTVKGEISYSTGMVMNIEDLKKYMDTAILKCLDHKNIDQDVTYFSQTRVSTAENIAVFVWEQLRHCLPNPDLLYEVKIHETEKNSVTYRGE